MMRSSDLSAEIIEVLPLAMRLIRAEMRGLAQPELTVAQFRILTRLDQGGHTNKQLAEWMGISAASVCRTVDVLVRRGFVSRSPAEEDRRQVSLVLTSKGKSKYESIKRSTRAMLEKRIDRISQNEKTELLTGLEHLRRIFSP